MVTILGAKTNKKTKFISIRWKLVSTYLLLVILLLIVINIFITKTITNIYLQEKNIDMLAKTNIIANDIDYSNESRSNSIIYEIIKNEVINYSKEINSRIIILDEEKTVTIDSKEEFEGEKFNHSEVNSALKGKSLSNEYYYKKYGHIMYTSVPLILNGKIEGAVLTSTSIDNIYTRVDDIKKALYLISIISIISIAVISFILANIFSKPIQKFTNAIMNMARGNLNQRVEIKTNDEFKQLANAFNIMSTKLDQVDLQRKDFVANVSHELRTPLSSIKLLSGSLLHQDKVDEEIYKEFLSDIDSEVDRLNNIIDDLLSLVDLDKEKLNLNYKATYINHLLEKIISRLNPLAKEKNITLKYNEFNKIQINLDKNKIQQAIINILHNAIKYTPENGAIDVSLYSKNKDVIIEITDDGIGIPEKDLEHIFERFYRVDKARTRNTGGTGLGLAIANQIVILHQGKIEVKSEINKGTSFYIKLPLNDTIV
ncbi:ATP-binding protein [Senegalia sp. (in: firmicutes)]|uniref:sensor histidine kinase n=2 Tax=Senegalia sp. (in: firmicutes) TaxID=1924098 RepID=UPI003F9504F1